MSIQIEGFCERILEWIPYISLCLTLITLEKIIRQFWVCLRPGLRFTATRHDEKKTLFIQEQMETIPLFDLTLDEQLGLLPLALDPEALAVQIHPELHLEEWQEWFDQAWRPVRVPLQSDSYLFRELNGQPETYALEDFLQQAVLNPIKNALGVGLVRRAGLRCLLPFVPQIFTVLVRDPDIAKIHLSELFSLFLTERQSK